MDITPAHMDLFRQKEEAARRHRLEIVENRGVDFNLQADHIDTMPDKQFSRLAGTV